MIYGKVYQDILPGKEASDLDLKVTPMQQFQQLEQKAPVNEADDSFRFTLLNTLEENQLKAGLATMMEDITQQGKKTWKTYGCT